jgi:fermentation-respiration switch protein FrsA (DUF1100 family)
MTFELPVIFHSQGVPLVGRFIRNTDSLQERQPVVIITGSWLTVKEQMATTYAHQLADKGYAAFISDFAGFGQSKGEPRQAEIPARKIGNILAAIEFVRTLSFVDPERVGWLAICATAQYVLAALARGTAIKSFASVAGWYHDPVSIAPFYGADAGIALRLGRAREALEKYAGTGELLLAPAYKEGDDRAGMHFRLDYDGRTDRGAIPAWKNEMAEMTWLYWLSFDGLSAADRVSTPSIFVHSASAVFPDHVKRIHSRLGGPKELAWTEGSQTDFYDQPDVVGNAVVEVRAWFEKTLRS